MKINLRILIISFLLVLCSFETSSSETYKEKIDQLRQQDEAADTAIVFYGTVKDQNERPVPGAKITAGLEHFSLTALYFVGIRTVAAESDNEGKFSFTGMTGKELSIRKIEKNGYKFFDNNFSRNFIYGGVKENQKFRPDSNNPIVFILHKKNEPGVVILRDSQMILRPIWEGFEFDIFKGFPDPLTKIIKSKIKSDIVVSILPAQNLDNFNVEIAAIGEENGFVEQSGELHIAPDSGYQPAITYTIAKGQETKKTIYHKGRGGKVYSRLEISLKPVSEGVKIDAIFYTNIEGSKNTEWDFDFTEQQVNKIMKKNIEYGSREYREAIPKILNNTIQKNP